MADQPALDQLAAALKGMREALQADGADLEVLGLDGATARLRLIFGPETCQECILSKEVLERILLYSLRETLPRVTRVALEDPRIGPPPESTSAIAARPLRSASYDAADAFEANELYQRNGWTDGLPIVPPTEERVRECLEAAGMAPGEIVGVEPVRQRRLTAEKVAINAVMAGCLPLHMPVVIAAVQAICEPEFNLHGSTASTGGSAQFIVVNGPIRRAIGMNATHNVLANGSRANATIGRAVRLVIINLLGGVPGQMDRSTLGHPGKFTFCVAEDEEDSPWIPLAQERGVPAGTSAVTVFACESPHQVMNEWTHDPQEILETFAAAIRANMLTYSIWAGNYALVIPKQLREVIAAAGWRKQDIREYVFQSARVFRRDWRTVGKANVAGGKDEDREHTALRSPDDLLVVAAGGPAGGFGAMIPPWLGHKSLAVTKRIGA